MIEIFTRVCLPILVLAAAGWIVDRRFRLDIGTLVRLNLYLVVPGFIFTRVYESSLSGPEAARIVGFTAAMIASLYLLSSGLAAVLRASRAERLSLNLAAMFYNCGNYGLPLVTLAFGAAAQKTQVFVLMTMNVATFSIGLLLTAAQSCTDGDGGRWRRLLPVLRQPSIHAILLALVLRQVPIDLREIPFLWEPLRFTADALVAVALVTLGVQLSQTAPPPIRGKLAWALMIRLAASPALAFLLAAAFGFGPAETAVLVAGAGAPTAVNTALLAHEFRADSRFAAAAVFYSTLLSFLTMTALLLVLRPLSAGAAP